MTKPSTTVPLSASRQNGHVIPDNYCKCDWNVLTLQPRYRTDILQSLEAAEILSADSKNSLGRQ